MGMGKTRVVVPMLVMEWLSKPWLTRLTVLPSVLHEAVNFNQNTLVASVQLVKLYTMPFIRIIPLNEQIATTISSETRSCMMSNGFLVVAPTHRNSLLLRQYDKGVLVRGLQIDFRDIIDESDAVLSHDFQLVYAIGEQMPLPNGSSRWHAVEALLVSLANGRLNALSKPGVVHADQTKNGSFPRLRLLEAFFTDDHKHTLGCELCEHIFRNPTYEFRWMKECLSKKALVRMLSRPEVNAIEKIEQWNLEKHSNDILALRGLIAYGSLFNGLASRHRVQYGLSETSGRLFAMPFSASETPKERSEFSHPDMAILYTSLAFLHTGLTMDQFTRVMKSLQEQGPQTQREIYREWIEGIRERQDVDSEVVDTFDSIEKIDLTNKLQTSQMHTPLGRSMHPIFY